MMITFENVSKFYDAHPIFNNISFSLAKGEIGYVTGPTGAGKTTLLRLIYYAERADQGTIEVGDFNLSRIKPANVPLLRRHVGVVFQDFRLLDNLTVFDNVALALRIRGMSERDIRSLVQEALKSVHLRHKADSYPPTLSGGEQQRAVIARAIVAEPPVILADEPTGNLDADTASHILRLFLDINLRGITILIATHNRDLYRHAVERVYRIDNGSLVVEEVE